MLWRNPATRCPMGRQRAGSGAGPRQRRLPPAVPGAPLRLRHRPHRRPPVRPSANRSCQRHCPIGPLGVPALAASGLPLPTWAESSCRRQPRVNTVGVCADEPPARRPAGYRAGPAVRRRPGPAGWSAGRDHRGAASAAATGDQGLVACGLASFRGRAACAVCQRTARPELASAMGGSDSTVPRWGRVAVPAAGAAAYRGHAPAPADRRRPGGGMAAVRANRLRARLRGEREYEFAGVGCSSPKAVAGS